MKKTTIVIMAALALGAAGCKKKKKPAPSPSPSASPELGASLTPEQLNRVVQRDRAALQ